MEYEMIGPQGMAAIVTMLAFGLFVPIIAAIMWTKIKKEKFTTVLLGAAGFAAFAIVLEAIPKMVLFSAKNAVGCFVRDHAWAYILVGALLAGLFEETARFFVFKVLIKKRKNKETAVSYGIGHGGIEVIFLLATAGINNLIYAVFINAGLFGTMVEQSAMVDPNAAAQLNQIAVSLAGLQFTDVLVSIWERLGAVMLHVACSIIVFRAVREKGKQWMYPLAIVIHTLVDCIAGMYQVGIITNIYVLETMIFVASLAVFVYAIYVYRKMPAVYKDEDDEAEDKQLEDIKKLGL